MWYLQNATQLIKRFHLANLPPLSFLKMRLYKHRKG
jgi:hypothetical protein